MLSNNSLGVDSSRSKSITNSTGILQEDTNASTLSLFNIITYIGNKLNKKVLYTHGYKNGFVAFMVNWSPYKIFILKITLAKVCLVPIGEQDTHEQLRLPLANNDGKI